MAGLGRTAMMLIPEVGKQDRQRLHSSRKENGPKLKEVVMNMKQMRFRNRHFLSYLQRRKVVFRENRKHMCGLKIKLGHFSPIPVVFGKEVVEKRDQRGGKG